MGKSKKKRVKAKNINREICEVKFSNSNYRYMGRKGINIVLYILTILPFIKSEVYNSTFSLFYMCITFPLAPILDIINTKNQYSTLFSKCMFAYFGVIETFGVLGFFGILNISEGNIVFDNTTILNGVTLFSQRNFMVFIVLSITILFIDFLVSGFRKKGNNIIEGKRITEGV